MACNGNCGACQGCGKALELTQAELAEEQTEVLEENDAPSLGLTM